MEGVATREGVALQPCIWFVAGAWGHFTALAGAAVSQSSRVGRRRRMHARDPKAYSCQNVCGHGAHPP